jgi:hypothetical protein
LLDGCVANRFKMFGYRGKMPLPRVFVERHLFDAAEKSFMWEWLLAAIFFASSNMFNFLLVLLSLLNELKAIDPDPPRLDMASFRD